MQRMRDDGATFQEIGDAFHLHHTTVMHHLSIGGGWCWTMAPHDILAAQKMRAADMSYAEIARNLHYGKPIVRRTLMSANAQRDLNEWIAAHPPKPPSVA